MRPVKISNGRNSQSPLNTQSDDGNIETFSKVNSQHKLDVTKPNLIGPGSVSIQTLERVCSIDLKDVLRGSDPKEVNQNTHIV